GAKVSIYCRGSDDHITYEMGPTEETGDIVADALYERNRMVEEKLNIDLDIVYGPTASGEYSTSYYNLVIAGDHVYDIIATVHAAGIKYSHEGIFTNLADAPYIDYDAEWWNYDYIKEVAVNEDNLYMLVGDISLFALRNLSAMFYNKNLYGSLYDKGDGLYDIVLDGGWTHDTFRKMVTESYRDSNGDGTVDENDIIGASGNLGTKADHYSYPAGIRMTERDADGYPKLVEDQTNNIAVMEALNQLYYHTKGFIIKSGGSTVEEEWTRVKFMADEMMFLGDRLYNAEYFRDMESEFGIIPMPKLNEKQEDYKALVHNSAMLYVVPITMPSDRLEMACATLEALAAQSYRTVTTTYFDVAMKVKYSRDETSGQVMDMLREAMMTEFAYANSSSLDSIGTIGRVLLGKGADASYMSHYESIKTSVQTKLDNMIAKVK
nr:hypothetical protein [Clostridia bacterium]